MTPVMALQPQANERILDMSAAPGGKTSYAAQVGGCFVGLDIGNHHNNNNPAPPSCPSPPFFQLMKNTGLLVANDLKPERQKATIGNLHRLGVRNAIVCSYDGRRLPKVC